MNRRIDCPDHTPIVQKQPCSSHSLPAPVTAESFILPGTRYSLITTFLSITCISFLRLTTYDLRLLLFSFFILCTFISLRAQPLSPLSTEMNLRMEYRITQVDPSYFTVIKPYLQNDSVFPKEYQPYRSKTDSWFKRKLLHESFVEVDSGEYYLFFDPAFDLTVGQDNSGRRTFTNTRGFNAGGRLGKSFAFGTSFYENQAILPLWVHNGIKNKIITGQGRGRLSGNTWDYAHASGYVSFSPLRPVNIQLGQGKNFIGDGYRSLMLSDVAYNYPYGRITFHRKRWMYSWMLGVIQDISISNLNDQFTFGKRMITSHLVSANVTKWLQMSVIKNTVYNNPDTTGRVSPDLAQFNPVILPLNARNSHTIWGLNLKAVITPALWIYSQAAFDNLLGNRTLKVALQAGFKYFDAFGAKGLYLQGEFNQVQPATYSWDNKTLQWLHYGEPLAHPYGNNFSEGIVNIIYSWRRWQLQSFTTLSRQSKSSAGSTASDGFPFLTNNTEVLHNDTRLNWFLNPKTTAHFSLGYITRRQTISGFTSPASLVYFAFRTSLFNNYLAQ